MGFGLLFFGYFLLLNISYFCFTDLIMALLLIMSCYKLSPINKYFKKALIPFAALGLFEFGEKAFAMFNPGFNDELLLGCVAIVRYIMIAVFSFLILQGISAVAAEVDIPKLAKKAKTMASFSGAVFMVCAFLELPSLGSIAPIYALTLIGVILLIASFVITIINLVLIYSAYMQICMPEDLKGNETKKDGFFEGLRRREEEKQREYAEYKLEKNKKKGNDNGEE